MNKKMIFGALCLLAVSVLSFVSCEVGGDDGNGEGAILNRALAIHNHAHFQHRVSLDAADIAFRFNVYLTEKAAGNSNLNDLLYDLFNTNVTVTEDPTLSSTYELEFPNGNLLNRSGKVIITTGGLLLNEDNAEWILGTTKSYQKSFSYDGDYLPVDIALSEYLITKIQNNTWTIDVIGATATEATEGVWPCASEWSIVYTLSQQSGDQSYDSFTTADFKLEGASNYAQKTLLSEEIFFAYSTTQYYNNGCNRNNPQAGSVATTTLYDISMNLSTKPEDKVKYSWLNPEGTSKCTSMRRIESGGLIFNL